MKLARMQLIVNLLPGGNCQSMFIDVRCLSLMNIIHFDLRRELQVFG